MKIGVSEESGEWSSTKIVDVLYYTFVILSIRILDLFCVSIFEFRIYRYEAMTNLSSLKLL